jgi:hypothetical protein
VIRDRIVENSGFGDEGDSRRSDENALTSGGSGGGRSGDGGSTGCGGGNTGPPDAGRCVAVDL